MTTSADRGERLARLEGKVDTLIAAFVKPQDGTPRTP